MEELVKMVAEKVGIPEFAAEQAVSLVIGQLKDKLPAPLDDQIEGILSGDVDPSELLGSLGGGGGLGGILKSLMGGK